MPTGLFVTHPLTGRKGRSLGRQLRADELRRRRGDGRAGARRTRFRVREEIRPADQAGGRGGRQDVFDRRLAGVVRRQGTRALRQLRQVRRPGLPGSDRRDRRRPGAQGPRRKESHLAPARLGHFAPALLGHADPDHPLRRPAATCRCRRRTCRSSCRKTCVPDGTGNPLNKHEQFLHVRVPAVRHAGAARNRHHGHLRRFVLVLHALLLADARRCHGRRAHRLLDADGPVHRRHRARDSAPAVCALLDQGDARPRPRQVRRTVQATCSRRAWC